MDTADLKWALHCARAALAYQKKTQRPERDGSRAVQIAAAHARVQAAEKAYKDAKPEPVSMRVRSPYFIGPRRQRGVRGDGPTIVCFRCEKEKPRDEFYERGTICRVCTAERAAVWGKNNPDKKKKACRAWGDRNKEETKRKGRMRYWANPEKYREAERRNRPKHRLKRNAYAREYLRRRKKTDHRWRALLTCKRRMWILFKSAGVKKNTRSIELMGIDRDGFYAHIESLMLPGMTWANRGKWGWHIDHKIPCSYFDMTDPVQAKACWHYTNLQPMWAIDNWRKGDTYDDPIGVDDTKSRAIGEKESEIK